MRGGKEGGARCPHVGVVGVELSDVPYLDELAGVGEDLVSAWLTPHALNRYGVVNAK